MNSMGHFMEYGEYGAHRDIKWLSTRMSRISEMFA